MSWCSADRFDEAESALRFALEIFPDEPDLLVNLAQIRRVAQCLGEALAALDRCVALAPQHPGYRVTRALVLLDSESTSGRLRSSTA
jgi:Flp pilus assembly protein TadD